MPLHRKSILVFASLSLLVACATPPPAPVPPSASSLERTKIDCGLDAEVWFDAPAGPPRQDRLPARARACEDLFKETIGAKIRVLPEEEGDQLIRRIWEQERLRDRFDVGDSMAFWGSLMGKEKMDEAVDLGMHPVDYYYDRVARNWHDASRRLNEIPIGSTCSGTRNSA